MYQISRRDLTAIYGPASVGRLVNGLIHNINGYLQNIGMDMDMMSYSLSDKADTDKAFIESVRNRLRRMDEEFEQLNRLLQDASMRANLERESYAHLSLDEFIRQVFFSLRANLYFKHNVRTDLQLEDDLPTMDRFPEDFGLALTWFIEALAEDLQRQEITALSVGTATAESTLRISLTVEGGALSNGFLKALEEFPEDPDYPLASENVGVVAALALFNEEGVSITRRAASDKTEIHMISNML